MFSCGLISPPVSSYGNRRPFGCRLYFASTASPAPRTTRLDKYSLSNRSRCCGCDKTRPRRDLRARRKTLGSAVEDLHLLIAAVGHIEKALLLVRRESDIEGRSLRR